MIDTICNHDDSYPVWDHNKCDDCGWILPEHPRRGINKGWFPSLEAVREFDKFKFYPGMNEIKPTKRKV